MNEWRIEVATLPDYTDPTGAGLLADIRELGIVSVRDVRTAHVFLVSGEFGKADIQRITTAILCDPVTEAYSLSGPISPPLPGEHRALQVFRKPGVTDQVAESTIKAIADAGLPEAHVRTGMKYFLYGTADDSELKLVGDKVLSNAAIEDVFAGDAHIPHVADSPVYHFEPIVVSLLDAGDSELERISNDGCLSLNVEEMKTIQSHFSEQGRDPTDIELEMVAQTWSEHCVHKTMKGRIQFRGKVIDNLLKSTIARVTMELDKPWCVSVFQDNAGVIRFDDDHDVCFKVETHNHPSAIEPYGGAGTGIGGVIRDPLGTGLGAKPILNTDVFCFAPPDTARDDVPTGCLHPKRVMKGVVAGVRDYGNRMGIPTANGAVLFDERYVGNPLVYCGNVGLMVKGKAFNFQKPEDLILVVGGRTGRDGIHGATFSSIELHEESETVSSGAVQIGNAIVEKRMVDTILQARDRDLFSAITDCGAGGLSSAVGEMGEKLGAEVDLERIPLKYEGLTYTEIWISEAQERMVLAVPPKHEQEILDLFASEDVEATIIGHFTDDGRLRLRYDGHQVADLAMEFLHEGVPQLVREAEWTPPDTKEPSLKPRRDYGQALRDILTAWNVCSKEWVIRQYDHEVQGTSVLKPLQGVENDGPGDACVIAPVFGSRRGLIVSNGINPRYGDLDPYQMAANAIDEAVRQVIAVGGNLDELALLDNFCWGNTNMPDRLGSLVLASQACYDIAKVYGTPFVSGKDSLNNEFRVGDRTIVIPPTLLISAIAVMDDVTKAISMDAKTPGNLIYAVGQTRCEMGGSHYYMLHDEIGVQVPVVRPEEALAIFTALSNATAAGLVRSCHDCSEGGIGVAAAEMAFAGGLGMRLGLSAVPRADDADRDDVILFSESPSRFIVEVAPDRQKDFENAMAGVPAAVLGEVCASTRLTVIGLDGSQVLNESLADLKEAWQAPLRW